MSDNAQPVMPAVPAQDQYPFWTWPDAFMFLGLALPSFLFSVAITRGLFLLLGDTRIRAAQGLTMQFLAYAVWFAGLYLMLKVRYNRPFWESLGWRVPWERAWVTLFLGPALALGVAVSGVLMRVPEIDTPFREIMADNSSVAMVGFFAVTLGPLSEELVFRGFLLPLLIRSFGTAGGVVICAIPFALLHGPQYAWSWRHLILLLFASLVFGITRIRTGSTAASALVHSTYNLTFYTGFLLQGKDLGI